MSESTMIVVGLAPVLIAMGSLGIGFMIAWKLRGKEVAELKERLSNVRDIAKQTMKHR